MIFDYTLPATVVHLRGDFPGTETHVRESFTESDLDAIAPLAPGDENSMGELCRPGFETLLRLEQRIKAAQLLKYGRTDIGEGKRK